MSAAMMTIDPRLQQFAAQQPYPLLFAAISGAQRYVFRVLLTGIHLMQTGKVEANLLTLNEKFQVP